MGGGRCGGLRESISLKPVRYVSNDRNPPEPPKPPEVRVVKDGRESILEAFFDIFGGSRK